MYLIKTKTQNPILVTLIAAIEAHQAAFQDYESAGRGLANTAHPLEMRFWTKELEKALGNQEETKALMLRRREALLTHMTHLLNARDAHNSIVEQTQHLKKVIAETYAYLDSEKPKDQSIIKSNLLLAIHEHQRKVQNLTTLDGPRNHLHAELNQALTEAFEHFIKQGNYCHLSGSISSALALSGSAYPVTPAVSNGNRSQNYPELRHLASPNKITDVDFPFAIFAVMEAQLEELRRVWKNYCEFADHRMRLEFSSLNEDQYGQQLLKLASGELNAGYAESLPKQQNARRLSYERIRSQYLALAREVEEARRQVAQSLNKAKEELKPHLPESKQNPHQTYTYRRGDGPCKPLADKQQVQQAMFRCLDADLVLRDIGQRFKRSLDEYSSDISGGKGQEVLDGELKALRERYETGIQIAKDLVKTNAVRLRQEATAARDTSLEEGKHFPKVQPPAGSITNVY